MPKPKKTHTPEAVVLHEERMERIKEATGARTQVQLAHELGVRQSSISDAKRRVSIPVGWLLTLLMEFERNPAWILHGSLGGSPFLKASDADGGIVNAEALRAEIEAKVRAEVDNLTTDELLKRLRAAMPGQDVVLIPDGRYDVHLTTRGDKVHGPREVTLVPLNQGTGRAPDRADLTTANAALAARG